MEDLEAEWKLRIQQAFSLPASREDVAWKRFDASLAERQGWLGFHMALEESRIHLRQAMTWVHRASAHKTDDPKLPRRAGFSRRSEPHE